MTQNGTTSIGSRTAGPIHLTQPCPPGMPCAEVIPQPHRETYPREQLSNAEAAELTQAKAEADAMIAAARPAIDTAVGTLLRRERTVEATLYRLSAFAGSAALRHSRDDVRRVRERHEHDGPEDRRRRPGWVRWALWAAIPAAALYDTAFFAAVFLTLIDSRPDPTSVTFYFALLPGVIITFALLAAGHWLGEAFVRARAHTERTPERVPFATRLLCVLLRREAVPRQRARDALPWPRWTLPVVFAVLVIGTLGIWAYNRALQSEAGEVNVSKPAVAMLLLTFTVTAIAIKVVYHNPFADSARDADRRLARTMLRVEELTAAAGTAVADFEAANVRLGGMLDDLTARAFGRLDLAWQRILQKRHEHGRAGTVAPPFTAPEPGSTERSPLLEGLAEPRVWLTPVHVAHRSSRDDEVRSVRKRLRDLTDEVGAQDVTPNPAAQDQR